MRLSPNLPKSDQQWQQFLSELQRHFNAIASIDICSGLTGFEDATNTGYFLGFHDGVPVQIVGSRATEKYFAFDGEDVVLGDETRIRSKNFPAVGIGNIGSNIVGGVSPLTSSYDGGTLTSDVDIGPHQIQFGFGPVTYAGGNIPDLDPDTPHTVYGSDPTLAGGTVPYVAVTAENTHLAQGDDGRIWYGDITTANSTSGETGGSGGSGCVAVGSWIMDDVYAEDLVKGSRLIVWDTGKEPWLGEVIADPKIKIRPRVMLETETGVQLECSVDTPITQPDGRTVKAAHLHGGMLYTEQHDGSWEWERVKAPIPIPDGPVVHLNVGGISLAAARPKRFLSRLWMRLTGKRQRRIITHNMAKPQGV